MSSNNKKINMNSASGYTSIMSHIVGVYVFLMLAVFPLFITDKYFAVLKDKFYFCWVVTAVTGAIAALVSLYYLFKDKGVAAKRAYAEAGGIKGIVRLPDVFFAGFMLVSIISTVFSRWTYETFWGNMGRYQGLFLWLWFTVCYILVSRFFRFDKRYINVFLLAGFIVAIFGITDCFNLDILGWRAAIPDHKARVNFSSTMGNVNSLTSVTSMYLGVAAVMFIIEDDRRWSLAYYITSIIMFMCMVAGLSDNAVIAIGILLCFLPFFAWSTRRGLCRYLLIVTAFAGAMLAMGLLVAAYKGEIVVEWSWGVLLKLAIKGTGLVAVMFAASLGLSLIAYMSMFMRAKGAGVSLEEYMSGRLHKGFRIVWGGMGIAAAVILVWMFYDANHGGHPEFFGPLSNIFIFNDSWGTHRGLNWSTLFGYMKDFNLFEKLFGAGPESYGIYTEIYSHYSMAAVFNELYDSPHNEWLQYLFSTGILGFVGYYGGVISSCVRMFRKSLSKYTPACAFAILMYTMQSVINISTPVVTPIVIMLISLGVNAAYRGEKREREKACSYE